MPGSSPDPAHPPIDPQFALGATSDEAEMHAQLANTPIGPPGDIVARLGQQFTLPRASPDSEMSQDMHGED
jgi:hypothetical protein